MDDLNRHVHANALQTEISAYLKASKNNTSIKSKILLEMENLGELGLTPDEFVTIHGGLINTIRRRFTDLWKEGKIKHHPKLLTRKNFAGNDCVLWVIGKDDNMPEKKQKKWVGLTTDEIAELVCNLEDPENRIELGQKIEAKLKEKNT